MTMVFARKYRPKTLEEVVGQVSIVRTLSNSLTSKRLHHAYLFVGKFGTGKCVAPDTLVWTLNGLNRIRNIVPNTDGVHSINCSVYDESGIGLSSFGYYEKDAVVFNIETRDGFHINATPEHPIRVWNKNGIVWKQVGDIREGDWIPIVRSDMSSSGLRNNKSLCEIPWEFDLDSYLAKFGDSSSVECQVCHKQYGNLSTHLGTHGISSEVYRQQFPGSKLTCGHSLRKNCLKSFNDVSLPDFMPVSFARLCGYMLSEGGVWKKRVFVTNSDPKVLKDIEETMSLLNIVPKVYHDKRTKDTFSITIESVKIAEVFKNLGLGKGSYEKRVPDFILKWNSNWIREFLCAYFEGDGGVDGVSVSCSSRSLGLMQDVQSILLYHGIISSISKSMKGATNGLNIKKEAYALKIYGNDVRLFAKKFGFISRRKNKKLQEIVSVIGNNPNKNVIPFLLDKIVNLKNKFPILSNGYLIKDGKGALKQKWPTNLKLGNYGNKNVTYKALDECLNYYRKSLPYLNDELQKEVFRMIDDISFVIKNDYFFSPVKLVNKGRSDVLDICKDGEDHSFFANGIINHNTSVSRILAASENCKVSPGLHPCGKCEICKPIFAGAHTDVSEIDAAGNAGKVDQIRELKKSANYHPIDGANTKYFIIDECLPAETKVTMSNGLKIPIGELVENSSPNSDQSVKSMDMSASNIIDQKICRYIKIPNDKQMYKICIKGLDGSSRNIMITGNHNIFVKNEGKIKAENLKIGQKVFLQKLIGEIVSIDPIPCDDEFVYNLEVESENSDNKNYFADGVLVSNCHRMTPSAEESLLKLIEEPPDHVRFVLCTTELEQMRDTILSRCQIHEFKEIYWREISRHLEQVSKAEKIQCDQESLNLCAKLSRGSMRDALQNLEKLSDYVGGSSISIDQAQEAFGSVSDLVFYELIDQAIGNGGSPNATVGYKIMHKLIISGVGINTIISGISEVLRHILICITTQDCADMITVSKEASRRLMDQSKRVRLSSVIDSLKRLTEVKESIEYGFSPQIALELWFLDSLLIFHSKGH